MLLKTWKKFRKPGKNFDKTIGNPVSQKHLYPSKKQLNKHSKITRVAINFES